jgi:hypothetical protein
LREFGKQPGDDGVLPDIVMCDIGEDALWEAARDNLEALLEKQETATELYNEVNGRYVTAKQNLTDAENAKTEHELTKATYDEAYEAAQQAEQAVTQASLATVDVDGATAELGRYTTLTANAVAAVGQQRDRLVALVRAKASQDAELAALDARIETLSTTKQTKDTELQTA